MCCIAESGQSVFFFNLFGGLREGVLLLNLNLKIVYCFDVTDARTTCWTSSNELFAHSSWVKLILSSLFSN